MIELSKDELKNCQLRLLDIFMATCENNDLTFYIYYGSLIGAVRHKGFIPWDDDIDVAMPRSDYEKLISLDWKQYGTELITSKNSPYMHYKLSDTHTILIEEMDDSLDYLGVNIDIFPIDCVPNNHIWFVVSQSIINTMKLSLNFKVVKTSKNRSIFKNVILTAGKILLKPIPASTITRVLDKFSSNSSKNAKRMGSCLGPYGSKEIFDRSIFHEIQKCDFEGRCVTVLACYDEILTGIYGDYNTLPPENKRASHHAFKAYHKAC